MQTEKAFWAWMLISFYHSIPMCNKDVISSFKSCLACILRYSCPKLYQIWISNLLSHPWYRCLHLPTFKAMLHVLAVWHRIKRARVYFLFAVFIAFTDECLFFHQVRISSHLHWILISVMDILSTWVVMSLFVIRF